MMSYLQKYFISGLLVWLPIWITILVVRFLVDLLDSTLVMLPKKYQPDQLLGFHVPGIGVLIIVLVILFTGFIAANFLGRKLVDIWDAMISRIPLVRSLYTGVKQVLVTVLTPNGKSFRKVYLVEYPHAGTWTIAFQTGGVTPEIDKNFSAEDMVSLYVPTTPNPTSGFLLMMPKKSVIELNMSVEQALKFVISLGVVQPNGAGINKSK